MYILLKLIKQSIRCCFWRKSSIKWNYVISFYTNFGEGGKCVPRFDTHIFFFYVYSPISLKWLNQSGWFFLYLVAHMLRLVLLKNFVDSVIVNYFFFFFKKTFIFAPIIYFIYVRRFLRNGLTNQDNFFCNLRGMLSRWSSYKTFLHLFFVNYIFCKNPIFMYVRLSRIGLKYRNGTFRIL